MVTSKPVVFGLLSGILWNFELVGDSLPLHTHARDSVHVTVVVRGSVSVVWGSELKEIIGRPGMVIDFDVDSSHVIAALEPGTRIINLLKYPKAVV